MVDRPNADPPAQSNSDDPLSDDDRYRLAGAELLRRGRARIDAAKAAEDLTPLTGAAGKYLFSAFMTIHR